MPRQSRYIPLILFSVLVVRLGLGAIWAESSASQARTVRVPSPSTAGATDMFIKIGDIEGESKASGHEGWIDVLSWSWGEPGSGERLSPPGSEAGALTIVRHSDPTSPRLTQACTGGRSLGRVVVHRRVDTRYEEYAIEDARISDCSAGSRGGVPVETITLTYSKIDTPASTTPARVGGDPDRPVVTGR